MTAVPREPDDRRAIEDLLVRYATGIDRRDWELFRTCFTPDCRCDYGSIGQWKGVDEITAFMEQAHAGMGQTLHRITNPVIAVDGDTATSRSYVQMIVAVGNGSMAPFQSFGLYDDELVRAADGWCIAERTFTMVACDDPAVLLGR